MENVRTARIGIIGGGFGALIVYAVLRFRGVPTREIQVFSADKAPGESWLKMVKAIGQKAMRSESVGHFYPTDAPGLATIEAIKRHTLKPIIQSWFDHYHPTVEDTISHAHAVAKQVGFWKSLTPARITRIVKESNEFVLYAGGQNPVSRVQNLILAVGHAAPMLPEPVRQFKAAHPEDLHVNGAFDDKDIQPGHPYVVIGDGLSAATEWIHIIKQGGCVIAISLKGFEFGQPLTTPRKYMTKRGLAPYRKKSPAGRCQELIAATRAKIPFYPGWKKLFRRAIKDGALHLIQGNVTKIAKDTRGQIRVTVERREKSEPEIIEADQVIAATGFYPAIQHPLLRQLISDYDLPVHDRWLVLNNDCCIERLSTPGSVAAVLGHASAWAIPCADSFNGIKIGARRLAEVILGPESWRPRALADRTRLWWSLIQGKKLA